MPRIKHEGAFRRAHMKHGDKRRRSKRQRGDQREYPSFFHIGSFLPDCRRFYQSIIHITKSVTHSTAPVPGNISTGVTSAILYPAEISAAASRARVAGSQET